MPLQTSVTWRERIRILAEKRNFYLQEIHKINLEHNTIIPVAQFPPEILSDIFRRTIYWPACPREFPLPSNKRPLCNTDVRAISQVCRHWREVALHDPSLWTFQDGFNVLHSSLWHDECAKRSQNYPLTVRIMHGTDRINVNPILQQWAERIRDLDLLLSVPAANESRTHVTLHNMSQLRSLKLVDMPTASRPYLWGGNSPPYTLDIKNLPRLESLEITRLPFLGILRLIPLENLRHLSLERHEIYFSAESDILDILRRCSQLRTLSLTRIPIPWPTSFPPQDGHRPTHLLDLESLELVGALNDAVHYISHFSIPSSCQVSIESSVPREGRLVSAHFAGLASFLVERLSEDRVPTWFFNFDTPSGFVIRYFQFQGQSLDPTTSFTFNVPTIMPAIDYFPLNSGTGSSVNAVQLRLTPDQVLDDPSIPTFNLFSGLFRQPSTIDLCLSGANTVRRILPILSGQHQHLVAALPALRCLKFNLVNFESPGVRDALQAFVQSDCSLVRQLDRVEFHKCRELGGLEVDIRFHLDVELVLSDEALLPEHDVDRDLETVRWAAIFGDLTE